MPYGNYNNYVSWDKYTRPQLDIGSADNLARERRENRLEKIFCDAKPRLEQFPWVVSVDLGPGPATQSGRVQDQTRINVTVKNYMLNDGVRAKTMSDLVNCLKAQWRSEAAKLLRLMPEGQCFPPHTVGGNRKPVAARPYNGTNARAAQDYLAPVMGRHVRGGFDLVVKKDFKGHEYIQVYVSDASDIARAKEFFRDFAPNIRVSVGKSNLSIYG